MGKMIVIEGLDGSGKGTQATLLLENLKKSGRDAFAIDLPNYSDDSSALVRMYLRGEMGRHPGDVNAYAASTFFAVDRYASFKKFWGNEYDGGKIIVANRYTTSNACHQMTKLPEAEWNPFLDWLFDFEYRKLGIPAPDCVVFLDMPVEVSQKLLEKRYENDESKKDIHELDVDYLHHCRFAANYACDKLGWERIVCAEAGRPKSVEEISRLVFETACKYI